MSLIHPQIRMLRAEADALDVEADHLKLQAPGDNAVLVRVLKAMAIAKRNAADRLHKDEMDLLERAVAPQLRP